MLKDCAEIYSPLKRRLTWRGGWSNVAFGIFWAAGEIAGSIFSAHKVKSVKA
jgi:hypothetical protein